MHPYRPFAARMRRVATVVATRQHRRRLSYRGGGGGGGGWPLRTFREMLPEVCSLRLPAARPIFFSSVAPSKGARIQLQQQQEHFAPKPTKYSRYALGAFTYLERRITNDCAEAYHYMYAEN